MIVDYENNPKNSIIYTSSIVLLYLKQNNGRADFEELFQYCKYKEMEYSRFFLTLDWMFLVRLIENIGDGNEVVLCD